MTDHEARIDDVRVEPAAGWQLELTDPARGLGRLVNGSQSVPVLVEGAASDWVVTLRGRRIGVTVRSWREQLMAASETDAADHAGPIMVKATLPGLVVAVAVSVGDEVAAGTPLLTIEAMKMQNEVRAPRAGRVVEMTVTAGEIVAAGAPLMRLE